jgi:hypothetical protein
MERNLSERRKGLLEKNIIHEIASPCHLVTLSHFSAQTNFVKNK